MSTDPPSLPPVPPAIVRCLQRWIDTPCLVAVSGGCDSVALLHLLAAVGGRPAVGHVRHGLRDDDYEDAALVQSIAARLGLDCHVESVDAHPDRNPPGESVEARARRLRYDALARVAASLDRCPVLVAHTADDQTETILFRLIRGTGLDGLAGMSPTTTRATASGPLTIERPLLDIPRRDLVAWLTASGHRWRDDPTNASDAFTRNRLRHEVLPLLRTINPQVDAALRTLGRHAAAARAITADRARSDLADWLDRSPPPTPDHVSLVRDAAWIAARPAADLAAILRLLWRRQRWPEQSLTARHWETLVAAIREFDRPARRDANGGLPPHQFDLPAVRVRISRDRIDLTRRRPAAD